ncbi:MAG TPA: NAD(P)/FAD-dependent oxidoreductase [Ktedonobacterales bacterium]|nr:NAD(P)/FAD-dependent oxidoreductase [Ktedonobacterales bacterium]
MQRIVILGGGFGGIAAAQHLDRRFRHDDDIEIELVSDTNFMVYTPMLADVAGGTIEPRHAVPPLRAFLKKARFREATVQSIDVAQRTVHGAFIDNTSGELTYDYLVIALGAVTNYAHATGAAEHTLGLKDLLDAIRVRNRALTLMEWAYTTKDPERRRELLTFVMAGGGFSGVEGIAALEDLLHGALRYYPEIKSDELRFILAPHGKRLLEEVDERLGEYVVEKFSQRKIDVRLGVGVSAVTERSATLTTGEVIPTRMVIWTAGIKVNPVLHDAALPKDEHGAVQVNGQMQVLDHPRIFALGDCAAVPMPDGQGFYAPTAQNSERQGPVAAANIAAMIRGSSYRRTFAYKPIGSLASLGQRQAVAQIGKYRISGLPAWFAWRGIYLAKLPTFASKVRIGLDWITNLFAPVDTVQLPIMKENLAATEARLMLPGTQMPTVTPSAPAAPVTG